MENIVLLFIIYSTKSYCTEKSARKKEYKNYFSRVEKIIKKLDQDSLKEFFDIIKEELNIIEKKTVESKKIAYLIFQELL